MISYWDHKGGDLFERGAYSLVFEEYTVLANVCKVCLGSCGLYKGDGGRTMANVELVHHPTPYYTGDVVVSCSFRQIDKPDRSPLLLGRRLTGKSGLGHAQGCPVKKPARSFVLIINAVDPGRVEFGVV